MLLKMAAVLAFQVFMFNLTIKLSDLCLYHVSFRCLNQEFFSLPQPDLWELLTSELKMAQTQHSLAIHAFILMGNHFHLLCHTPLSNIDVCLNSLLSRVSFLTHIQWDKNHHCSLIHSRRHYYHVYRYIFQNPIRAGIVRRVEDYPYSTLRGPFPFALHSNVPMSFCGHEGELLWLNQAYDHEDLELIRSGLRKKEFDLEKGTLKAFNKLSVRAGKKIPPEKTQAES